MRLWNSLSYRINYALCYIGNSLNCYVSHFRNHRTSKYIYGLSVVAIVKNEAPYIKEWLDFHIKQGIEHFYIYDNDSTDDTCLILKRYIDKGFVTYHRISGKGKQLPAYNHAIRHYRNQTKYMAVIDADEFLMSEDTNALIDNIESVLAENPKACGVAVNWRMYGSSGHKTKPSGGVIENFVYRASDNGQGNRCIKTIVNPRYVAYYGQVHYPKYILGRYSVAEDGAKVSEWHHDCGATNRLRINHYFTKSLEEWTIRRSMGKADHKDDKSNRTIQEFHLHDNNDIFDDIALRKSQALK